MLSDVRKMCKAKFCCILLLDEVEHSLSVLAEDRDKDSDRLEMKEYMDDDFYDLALSWRETMKDNNCIIVSNEIEMGFIKEKNIKWYESLKKAKVDSLVLVRLKNRNNFLGYMWVSHFSNDDIITIKETLELTTFILESEIGNYLLLQQLTKLSTIDLLTGVYNRNEMNNYMQGLLKDEEDFSIGLLFIDINGLKKVNDFSGHLMGDDLIKRAAEVLKAKFGHSRIFRAGGDEFVVVIESVNEKEINKIIDDLREEAKKKNVSFAIGYSLKKSRKELLEALNEADEAMYFDKRQHYSSK